MRKERNLGLAPPQTWGPWEPPEGVPIYGIGIAMPTAQRVQDLGDMTEQCPNGVQNVSAVMKSDTPAKDRRDDAPPDTVMHVCTCTGVDVCVQTAVPGPPRGIGSRTPCGYQILRSSGRLCEGAEEHTQSASMENRGLWSSVVG